jgi:hypothetical protein
VGGGSAACQGVEAWRLALAPGAPRANAGQLVTLIDMDHFIEGKFDPSPEWVTTRAYAMHDHLIETFHEHVVSEKAIELQYEVYLRRIGSSPMFRDERMFDQPVFEAAVEEMRKVTRQAVLRMSPADQVLELLAALSLNKTLLAELFNVSRPTLYDWLDGTQNANVV